MDEAGPIFRFPFIGGHFDEGWIFLTHLLPLFLIFYGYIIAVGLFCQHFILQYFTSFNKSEVLLRMRVPETEEDDAYRVDPGRLPPAGC